MLSSVWFHLFIVSLELLNSKERSQGLLMMQNVFLSFTQQDWNVFLCVHVQEEPKTYYL